MDSRSHLCESVSTRRRVTMHFYNTRIVGAALVHEGRAVRREPGHRHGRARGHLVHGELRRCVPVAVHIPGTEHGPQRRGARLNAPLNRRASGSLARPASPLAVSFSQLIVTNDRGEQTLINGEPPSAREASKGGFPIARRGVIAVSVFFLAIFAIIGYLAWQTALGTTGPWFSPTISQQVYSATL